MDFGMLPPEINSGRMYTGPGAGPMIAAAAAWDELAAELHATAAAYTSVIEGLAIGWQGTASTGMAAAAAPYAAWLRTTAAQAEQTAAQAKAAVSGYDIAFAATVPPPEIATNRSLLMSLIATNVLGQNTPAIAATEAHYAQMWAQDATAMYGYAATSAAAAQVTPFGPPPQTIDPAGTARQAAAVAQSSGAPAQTAAHLTAQLLAAAPQTLQSLATPAPAAALDPASIFTLAIIGTGLLNPVRLYGPIGAFYDMSIQCFLAPFSNYNMQLAYAGAVGNAASAAGGLGQGAAAAGSAGEAVSASMGQAGMVAGVSVPQGWASAAPAMRSVATVLSGTSLGAGPAALVADGQGSLFGNMALSGLAGRALAGSGGGVARTLGAGGAAASGGAATTATIIVIPED